MRKSSVKITFDNFLETMEGDIDLLKKLHFAEVVVRTREEKAEIHEAFVFKVCASWEIFTQDLLIDCLNKDTSQYSLHTGYHLPKHLSRDICNAMIFGVGYQDFKNVSHLKSFAKQVLVSVYNPFQKIPRNSSQKIDGCYVIRNYLAHYSYAAERKLKEMYRSNGMRRFREPGDFLMSITRGENITRSAAYILAFIEASKEMATFLSI